MIIKPVRCIENELGCYSLYDATGAVLFDVVYKAIGDEVAAALNLVHNNIADTPASDAPYVGCVHPKPEQIGSLAVERVRTDGGAGDHSATDPVMTIKSCPFCGGEGRLDTPSRAAEEAESIAVICMSCGAVGPRSWRSDGATEAIAEWNERVSGGGGRG